FWEDWGAPIEGGAMGQPPANAVDVRVEARRWRSCRRPAQWILLSAPVVAFVGAGWAHRWITDDGFIYLRVVQQIRAGNGPVFNDGQRVEAFTGPVWLAVPTIADAVMPIRLEWIAGVPGPRPSASGLAEPIAAARPH